MQLLSLLVIMLFRTIPNSSKRNATKCLRRSSLIWTMRRDGACWIPLSMSWDTLTVSPTSIPGSLSISSQTMTRTSKSRLQEFWLKDCKCTSPTPGVCASHSENCYKTPSINSLERVLLFRISKLSSSYFKRDCNRSMRSGKISDRLFSNNNSKTKLKVMSEHNCECLVWRSNCKDH